MLTGALVTPSPKHRARCGAIPCAPHGTEMLNRYVDTFRWGDGPSPLGIILGERNGQRLILWSNTLEVLWHEKRNVAHV